jgi:ketol-acid reductoisomerase
MSLLNKTIANKTVAILGYGNQGRAHALNLRDSGVKVIIGSRPGKSFNQALEDRFAPMSIASAISEADVLMWLLPDQEMPQIYQEHIELIKPTHTIGFAHGFCYHFNLISKSTPLQYFIAAPKGSGFSLRRAYEKGESLPGVFALSDKDDSLKLLVTSYLEAIGCKKFIFETNFKEETECDLFGEQAVLCGGLIELIQQSYKILIENGHSEEMAFFETCFEAKLILELLLEHGLSGMSDKISPTAFYGGHLAGKRLINQNVKDELKKIFTEIQNGTFAKNWMTEVQTGMKSLQAAKKEVKESPLQAIFVKCLGIK